MPRFSLPTSLSLSLALALLVSLSACGGGGVGGVDASDPAAPAALKTAARVHPVSPGASASATIRGARHGRDTLLIGTTNQAIVQVDLRSGRVLASLDVEVFPQHIVADEDGLFFGGMPLGRYDFATQQQTRFATSDGFTGTVGMAITPSGTLFASNVYYFMPDTSCGTCSTAMAYPDPSGQNPPGMLFYAFGYVRELAGGEGRLSGQQLGFTDDARMLVTSKAGDGIFVSTAPVPQICCGPGYIEFERLVADDSRDTLRFARRGHDRLLVLHRSGRIDEHDLRSGRLIRTVLQAGVVDPVDMVVSRHGTVYVLETSGQIRVFSERGRESARITLPAAAGQAISLALCCDAAPRRPRHRHGA